MRSNQTLFAFNVNGDGCFAISNTHYPLMHCLILLAVLNDATLMVKHVWTSEPKVIEVIFLYLIHAAAAC